MSPQSIPSTTPSVTQPDINSPTLLIKSLPVPTPTPNTTEHLIRVAATSPCAGELSWLAIAAASGFPEVVANLANRFPVPCYDLAGTVVIAPEGSPFPVGTEVYTRTPASRAGNAREYTIAATEELAVRPKNISWEETASVPLSVFTAIQGLFQHGGLAGLEDPERVQKNKDKSLLITAASGGVGTWVLQLAREAGVGSIVGVAGTSNVEFAKSLGATEVIDYRKQSVADWAKAHPDRKFDLIIDAIGGQTLSDVWYTVKSGGILLSIAGQPEQAKPKDVDVENVKAYWYLMETKGEQLNQITRLLEEGKVKAIVDSVFPFEKYQEAFDKVAQGHARGKVIIKIGA